MVNVPISLIKNPNGNFVFLRFPHYVSLKSYTSLPEIISKVPLEINFVRHCKCVYIPNLYQQLMSVVCLEMGKLFVLF